jgi:hypothetical protein
MLFVSLDALNYAGPEPDCARGPGEHVQPMRASLPLLLQQALPECVLQRGGSAAGFLYFNQLQEKGPVVFAAEIVAAGTREPLGAARIPMMLQ